MALGNTPPYRTARPRRDYVPPLPHSSWRLSTGEVVTGAARLTSASDFWNRLGL